MRFFLLALSFVLVATAASAGTLKVGDTLSVSVLQEPKLDRTVVIDPTGEIAFPLAGHIRVAGLTPEAVENLLKAKLKPNYKDDLDVTVALASIATPDEDLKPKIFVTGEVARPGSFDIRQPTTLMQAIALAGGVGPFAAQKRIQVHRRAPGGDETIFMFNYSAYQAGLDLEGNIVLRAGDVVIVPERGLFD